MATRATGTSPDDEADGRSAEPAAGQRRRRDAAATRQALLQAARSRFIRLGYERTTLRDVAADAEVNLALIKRYFGSKEGLFKASLASAPRFLGRDGDFPQDRATLAEALSLQLAAGAWPDFGEHPVLMLLRNTGDEQVDELRRQALQEFSRQVLEASGAPVPHNDDEHPAHDGEHSAHNGERLPYNHDERLLRAELLVALGVGVAVVRSAVGLQPLRDATSDELLGPLRDVVDGLLAPRTD
ncbi:AcrR family transcriptional regulator [Streptomyces umbrinus]|uniref:AcrR family transcriptional regulator n=1 Tax=Streptomyces umbrinus TaxID=67370 RepID=A0ABU0T8G1_9ACTN|nr:TetR/AcrR family transcriptional regulator [Streptomyces umbrinus]MDQ1032104.1 AcrR family transcriptional regulator [Streptomyces umbrinus]